MPKKTFLIESLKNLKTVGTVTQSSAYLCKEILKEVHWKDKMVLVELGAGDGVITKHILKKMGTQDVLIAFELNEEFCKSLQEIQDKRLVVIQDNADTINEVLKKMEIEHIDHIISAIPFVLLDNKDAENIIRLAIKFLHPDGKFIQVHYSTLAKKLYEKIFSRIEIKFVPFNVPPVFLHVMKK